MRKTPLASAVFASAIALAGVSGTVSAGHAKHWHDQAAAAHGGHATTTQRDASKPRLGVAIEPVGQTELDAMSLEFGVRIARVMDGSAAASAGLMAGDVVTEVGGRPAYSTDRLLHLVANADAETTIAVKRGDDTLTLPLAFKPAGRAALGIRIQGMTADLKAAFGTEDEQRGVLISQVSDDTAADRAGLKAGDVIVDIAGQAVMDVGDVKRAVSGKAPGDAVDVTIFRDRSEQVVAVTLGTAVMAGGKAGHAGKYGQMPGHGGKHDKHGMHGKHGMYGKHGKHGMYGKHGKHGMWHGDMYGKHGHGGMHGKHGAWGGQGCHYSGKIQRPS